MLHALRTEQRFPGLSVDNLGAYVRAPEPATTFRPLGNYVGPYRVQNVELNLRDVVSNKVPTGPNRGYGCHQVYLETERTLDEAALQLGHVDEATFERVVDPAKMVKPYVANKADRRVPAADSV